MGHETRNATPHGGSRIFFASLNTAEEPYPVYPLGMAVCSAALVEKGHQVLQFDFLAAGKSEEKLLAALKEFGPDFICFSLRNIDNVDSFTSKDEWYLNRAKRLVNISRDVCPAPVILGGPGFSIMPEAILAHVGGDYGVKGEGERALCELVEKLEKGETPPPIISTADNPLRGADMPPPLYEKEIIDFYLEESGVVNVQTKRGCPYNCVYCTYPSLEGKEFRFREAGAVVDDIERTRRDYNARNFFFTDSVFNDPQDHHLEVVEEIIRRDIHICWGGFFTPRQGRTQELALMKRSGLYAVELGTDAGCDRTLSEYRKGFTFADVIDFNDACVENEIPCCHFIIFGGPGESEATIAEALANIDKLRHCVVVGFSGIRILPRTPLYRRAVDEGLIGANDPLLKSTYYISSGIDHHQMNDMLITGFAGRRDRIFPPNSGKDKVEVMKKFGFKGLLWDKLIRFPQHKQDYDRDRSR